LTKYFKAQVEIRQTVTVEVAADSEVEAKARAKEIALQKVPNTRAGDVQLEFLGESDMHVGMRVVHSIFGPGVVEEFDKAGGVKGAVTFMVKVKFDRGDTKQIHHPHASLKPESF
jgi:hypothetical protein